MLALKSIETPFAKSLYLKFAAFGKYEIIFDQLVSFFAKGNFHARGQIHAGSKYVADVFLNTNHGAE